VRDLIVFLFTLAYLPLALSSPFCAFLLWSWGGLIAIQSHLYGFMLSVPLVQIFAAITLALLLLPSLREKITYHGGGVIVLMVLIVVHGLISATLAYPGMARNWDLFSNMAKTILLCLLFPLFLVNRDRINLYVLMLAMGVCFHGMVDGLKYVSSGGAHNAHGILKFGDNNHYALVLLMALPLLIYTYRFASHVLVRWGAMAVFFLTFMAVLATNSRGALLSAVAMGIWVIMMGKKKIAGLFVAALLGVAVLQLAPAKWFERMDTIQSADQDESFMGRVTAWKRASAIAIEHPVFGGGYHAGQFDGIFEKFRYKPGLLGFVDTPEVNYPAATHSIYFEVLGDLGFVGLGLFLAAIGSAFYNWMRIRRYAGKDPAQHGWALELANMLSASMVVYTIGGAALSAAYFELPYYIIMLMQVLWTSLQYPQAEQTPPSVGGRT
jgi:probable O-glycosylation ligase (exosortase A-associated)